MNVKLIPFDEAFNSEPVGKKKIKESDYACCGLISTVDQGKKLISGYTDRADLVREDGPYIVFGDHTRIVKYIDFPFVVGADGVRLFKASDGYDSVYLYYFLKGLQLPEDGYGRHSKYLRDVLVPCPPVADQRRIATRIKDQLAEVEKARKAAEVQLEEITKLGFSIVFESLGAGKPLSCLLGDVLQEVKKGIGDKWADYPVLGATRSGIAPAKEPPGKYPFKYKPVVPGTVFYNPMRILIGSIAFLEEGGASGITSPDYVVLQGKEGVVDSRWFYYWLRSPLGEQCITSLARGAVRERMLFKRLAKGVVELPDFNVQQQASVALAGLKPMREAIKNQLQEIDLLPQKILSEAFGGVDD